MNLFALLAGREPLREIQNVLDNINAPCATNNANYMKTG